jgi:hypothetical protein
MQRGGLGELAKGIYCNFARIHQTLRITPAMAARISDDVWSVEEIVVLLDRAIHPVWNVAWGDED